MLRVRSEKGSHGFYRRDVGWSLALTTNPAAQRKQFPEVCAEEQKGFLSMTKEVEKS